MHRQSKQRNVFRTTLERLHELHIESWSCSRRQPFETIGDKYQKSLANVNLAEVADIRSCCSRIWVQAAVVALAGLEPPDSDAGRPSADLAAVVVAQLQVDNVHLPCPTG